MKNIAWAGRSDARNLDAADFAKVGVDLSSAKDQSFIFPRHTAVQVTNEVAQALIDNPRLFGPFELTEAEEGDTLDFESLSQTPSGTLDTPQTGIDSPAPKKSARTSTSSAS